VTKPTTAELLEWLGFVLGSASFGGKADAIRAILAEHPKLQAELAQVKAERDEAQKKAKEWQEAAEDENTRLITHIEAYEEIRVRLAQAEPLLKAAMGPDEFKDVSMAEPWVKVTNERYKRIVRESDAYRKAAEAKEGEGETKAR
jgi:predicted  nucleic acid-binding Zn-ribbon protein